MLQRFMMDEASDHATLSDPDLLREVRRLVSRERAATAALIAALGELDVRRLYLAEGCSSLFTYCTHVLHLSEHAAYGRIEAARAARKWPVVLELFARRFAASDDSRPSWPAPHDGPAELKPIAPQQYKVQFTASQETYDKLRQAQDLLRHRIPDGDVALILDRALTVLLAELHRTKHGGVDRPRQGTPRTSTGRHVPAAVKRTVWDRDGGRCAFVGAAGRCSERGFLEYHHVVPFADRGPTNVENIELRCRAHNAYESARWFGAREEGMVRERAVRYEVQPW
jgi:hypothetical protein